MSDIVNSPHAAYIANPGRVPEKILAGRAVADLAATEWCGVEDGWLLVGKLTERGILIAEAIGAGPGSDRGPAHVRFDLPYVEKRLKVRRSEDPSLFICGTAHTHPPGKPNPSDGDLLALEPGSSVTGCCSGGPCGSGEGSSR